MKTSVSELKNAYRSAIQNRQRKDGEGCPSAEEMWTLLRKKHSRKRKAKMIDHITDCSDCHHEFQAFLEMTRAERALIENVRTTRSLPLEKKARPSWNWGYASGLVVLIGLIGFYLFSIRPLDILKRADERGRRSGQFSLLIPTPRQVVHVPLSFEWKPVSGAQIYVVEIFDASLLPVWKSPSVTGTSCGVPASVAATLTRKATYFWMLTAIQQDGTKAESPLEEFKLID